ncbi:DUF3392 domain-containing protein [Shewanella waksmanii]|uniref:DUF3392 domain-containing protein n=1 Tax=Shewanella waksmanii TaxID=213783 RepID=UPI00048E7AB5|nr:DUF3392 domain-containing protein [Shewanella waksmanii]
MEHFISFLHQLGTKLYPWLTEISTAIIACFLVVFGGDINRILRRKLVGRNFILRTLVFILINAFGFGLLIVAATPWLASLLSQLSSVYLLLILVAIFTFIGIWAQKNNQS